MPSRLILWILIAAMLTYVLNLISELFAFWSDWSPLILLAHNLPNSLCFSTFGLISFVGFVHVWLCVQFPLNDKNRIDSVNIPPKHNNNSRVPRISNNKLCDSGINSFGSQRSSTSNNERITENLIDLDNGIEDT